MPALWPFNYLPKLEVQVRFLWQEGSWQPEWLKCFSVVIAQKSLVIMERVWKTMLYCFWWCGVGGVCVCLFCSLLVGLFWFGVFFGPPQVPSFGAVVWLLVLMFHLTPCPQGGWVSLGVPCVWLKESDKEPAAPLHLYVLVSSSVQAYKWFLLFSNNIPM